MFVNGVRDIDQVTAADLVAEAAAWGMPTARAQTRLDALLTRLSAAIHAATGEVETPRDLVELVTSRVARLAG